MIYTDFITQRILMYFMNKPNIYVTKPLLPDLDDLYKELTNIWTSGYVTNMGEKHNLLEAKLRKTLKVDHLSLFNNGTIALLIALKALDLPPGSEVITTPFTFAATPHSIAWNNLNPVFCDIEPDNMCIDANKIEALITDKTSAILAVHVYGFPCNVHKIDQIAKQYNLKVIYDAAHAFDTQIDGKGIGTFGDFSMFSFHATKLFSTIEGGCLTFNDDDLLNKVQRYRNFGIKDEESVTDIGINGKMNELQAAIGLLNLDKFHDEQTARSRVKSFYDRELSILSSVTIPRMPENTTNSYLYYPILIEDSYSISRNELVEKLRASNIIARKYFYPLCSDYDCYKHLASSSKGNLPVANDIKNKILCLPFYSGIPQERLSSICEIIAMFD